ncbi:magnesium transporter MgtE N-terminal domain-containing protein [Terriglobus sp. TAA 43]|uniref:magnesium transporter MgtE N-terminal domain-containing protein n=1 Tax=Terriglobus sp. TAA 43 TaxID=278961 RepID=UPI000645CC40|nr:CBS domain-containing protein [Terriglobus sp. TAA 43]
MNDQLVRRTSLSSLLGAPVRAHDGVVLGRIAELVVATENSGTHISSLLLTASGRLRGGPVYSVPLQALHLSHTGELHLKQGEERPAPVDIPHASVLLERDLLDQQIIDVHGHKVVRVNDVDLVWEIHDELHRLRIAEVEVGMRGAVRRLLRGLPLNAVDAMAHRFQPRVIPWEFVDLIDRDPARRVRLKIEGDRLSTMHPSDIADILEELAPAEREAVFGSLNEEIAAEALEEVDPKLQRSLLEGMESSRVADIVEEMDPGAAADLLAELPEERSEEILLEMEPEERAEVEELLEFPEDWAAGRMTTEYVAVPEDADVYQAIEALRSYEGDLDTVNEVFLLDQDGRLKGAVTLAKLALSNAETKLIDVKEAHLHTCSIDAGSRAIAEQFDKYNLRSLAVLDHDRQLAGVIYPEHVIALLRAGH